MQQPLPVIGIIGGGQLGRMFIEEALRYNVSCVVLDSDPDAPAARLAQHQIQASITDAEAIHQLAAQCDVITYEIEHVFVDALEELEQLGKTVYPSAGALRIIQDKTKQKAFYRSHDIATSDFVLVNEPTAWLPAVRNKDWTKFVAKSGTDGYDGKGVQLMHVDDLLDPSAIPFNGAVVLEEFIVCEKEISVIVAVDASGNTCCYPAVEMQFDAKANLVTYLFSPAALSAQQHEEARALALKTALALNSPGIFAVEMFLDKAGHFLVNETAPRPHNSGHHTIEACYTSQYEQLLRILLHAPLGSTNLIKPAAMINILGDESFSGPYELANESEILRTEGVYIHMYGKKTAKPNRKLGHITILADNQQALIAKTTYIQSLIQIKPLP